MHPITLKYRTNNQLLAIWFSKFRSLNLNSNNNFQKGSGLQHLKTDKLKKVLPVHIYPVLLVTFPVSSTKKKIDSPEEKTFNKPVFNLNPRKLVCLGNSSLKTMPFLNDYCFEPEARPTGSIAWDEDGK